MPRRKSLVTVIREMVQGEVRNAMRGLLNVTTPKRRYRKSKNGRRRRRRPGRPPKA